MTSFTFETGSEAYPVITHELMSHGATVAPRALACRELCDVTVRVLDASRAVPVSSGRAVRRRIGAAEYCQLLAGVSWLRQLDDASHGNFAQFANEKRLRGAYGPRVHGQLPDAAAKLQADPDSRQAVVAIHRGVSADAVSGQRDVPCTVALQFRIRGGTLGLTVMMRSSDAWLGIPYDWWMFSRLQMTMAWALGVPAGGFTFFAGSLHLYEKDVPEAGMLRQPRDETAQPPALVCNYAFGKTNAAERIKDAQGLAERLVLGGGISPARDAAAAWYQEYLPVPEGSFCVCASCRYIRGAGETCRCPGGTGEEEKEERKR